MLELLTAVAYSHTYIYIFILINIHRSVWPHCTCYTRKPLQQRLFYFEFCNYSTCLWCFIGCPAL